MSELDAEYLFSKAELAEFERLATQDFAPVVDLARQELQRQHDHYAKLAQEQAVFATPAQKAFRSMTAANIVIANFVGYKTGSVDLAAAGSITGVIFLAIGELRVRTDNSTRQRVKVLAGFIDRQQQA